MKIVIPISLIFFICSCSQNKSKEVTILSKPIPKIYTLKTLVSIQNDAVFVNGKKYSGYIYQLLPNQVDTFFIEEYDNGLQTGIAKKWYAVNKLMEQRFFFNGKKNGKQIAFWENGNKKFEFTAMDDAYEGEMNEWNIDGRLIHFANYKNGQEEGTQKLWYDNGKIRANYFIINGKRYGLLGTKNCKNVSDSIFIIQ